MLFFSGTRDTRLNKGTLKQLFKQLDESEVNKLKNCPYVGLFFNSPENRVAFSSLFDIPCNRYIERWKNALENYRRSTVAPIPEALGKNNFSWVVDRIRFHQEKGDFMPDSLPPPLQNLRELLICMGEKWEDCAMNIIYPNEILQVLQDRLYDDISPIVRLARAHLNVADKLFSNLERMNLNISNCMSIAEKQPPVAMFMCQNSPYTQQLDPSDYAKLARAHGCVGKYVFKDNLNIGLSFNEVDLTECAKNPLNAKWLLKPPFLAKLSKDAIREIAICNFSVTETIFNDIKLSKKLDHNDIAKIAASRLDAAELVMNTPRLCNKLNTEDLVLIAKGNWGWKIALQILPAPEKLSELPVPSQVRIARECITLKGFRFDLPSLLAHLDSKTLGEFGTNYIFVAQYILKTPMLVSKLTENDLREIENTVKFYEIILETLGIKNGDELYEKSWEHLDPLGKTTIDQLCNKLHNTLQILIRESTEKDQPQQPAPISRVSQTNQLTKKYSTTHPSQEVSVTDERMTLSVFGKKRPTW